MKIILGTILALTLMAAPILVQAQQTGQITPDPNAAAQSAPQSTTELDNTASQNKAKADAANKKSKAAKKASNAQKNVAKQQEKSTGAEKNVSKQQGKVADAQQKAAAANAANAATPAPQ